MLCLWAAKKWDLHNVASVTFEDFEGHGGYSEHTPAEAPSTFAIVSLSDGTQKNYELTMTSELIREIVETASDAFHLDRDGGDGC